MVLWADAGDHITGSKAPDLQESAVVAQQQVVDLKKSGKSRLHLPKLEAELLQIARML